MFHFSFIPESSNNVEKINFKPGFLNLIKDKPFGDNSSLEYNFGLSIEQNLENILFTSTYDKREEYESSFSLSIQDALTLSNEIFDKCMEAIRIKDSIRKKELKKDEIIYQFLDKEDDSISEIDIYLEKENNKAKRNFIDSFEYKIIIQFSDVTGEYSNSISVYSNIYQSVYGLVTKNLDRLNRETKENSDNENEVFTINTEFVIEKSIEDFLELIKNQIVNFLIPKIEKIDIDEYTLLREYVSSRIVSVMIDKEVLEKDIRIILNQVKKDTDNALRRMDELISLNKEKLLQTIPSNLSPIKLMNEEDMEKLSNEFISKELKKGNDNE